MLEGEKSGLKIKIEDIAVGLVFSYWVFYFPLWSVCAYPLPLFILVIQNGYQMLLFPGIWFKVFPHPLFLILTWGYTYWFQKVWGGERERESAWASAGNIKVRETSIDCLPYIPLLGSELTTYACALTRNQTFDLLVYRTMLQPTEPQQLRQDPIFKEYR